MNPAAIPEDELCLELMARARLKPGVLGLARGPENKSRLAVVALTLLLPP